MPESPTEEVITAVHKIAMSYSKRKGYLVTPGWDDVKITLIALLLLFQKFKEDK